MRKLTYIPKGSMCMACDHKNRKECCTLNFELMPKMSKPDLDGLCVVKCSGFKQLKFAQP